MLIYRLIFYSSVTLLYWLLGSEIDEKGKEAVKDKKCLKMVLNRVKDDELGCFCQAGPGIYMINICTTELHWSLARLPESALIHVAPVARWCYALFLYCFASSVFHIFVNMLFFGSSHQLHPTIPRIEQCLHPEFLFVPKYEKVICDALPPFSQSW
jgi:hypothetical protein